MISSNKSTKYVFYITLCIAITLGITLIMYQFRKPTQFNYFAQNKCKYVVNLKFIDADNKKQSINISPNSIVILSAHNYVDFKHSNINNIFKRMRLICNNDTSKINYFNRKLWKYSEKNHVGNYLLEIKESNFKK
jgi:hypothetical protein